MSLFRAIGICEPHVKIGGDFTWAGLITKMQ
jgi:hypothetical protein